MFIQHCFVSGKHFFFVRLENGISNEGVDKLCEMLKQNETLTKLDLSGSKYANQVNVILMLFFFYLDAAIGTNGFVKIIETLKTNTALTELVLHSSSNDVFMNWTTIWLNGQMNRY